ncbi:hypothetical protein ACN38_g9387 [Penicillium nordicum]|uniref:Uncharacterized protein n=1 Tax=Penicillium nordicum TaxID=229535 RepID=A0A0M9WCQ8_9EURO|nr:hypothetical protein ACN38_g9387 [Penicillium nordicum]
MIFYSNLFNCTISVLKGKTHDCPACVIDNDFAAPQSSVFLRSFQLIARFNSNLFLYLKRKEKHYADPRILS